MDRNQIFSSYKQASVKISEEIFKEELKSQIGKLKCNEIEYSKK